MTYPKITINTPVLNAAGVLDECLKLVREQDYPQDKIEILCADGGSTDNTREIVKKYNGKVLENPLITGESGKAVAAKAATGKYIVLLDSDNYLPDKNWLKQMIEPLEKHQNAVGSEPWAYTWRKEDGFIARYCALIGMNDPFVHFLGTYDRQNLLTGTWTEVERKEEDLGDYLLVTFKSTNLPTIGANGTVFRTSYLQDEVKGDYLFDIDILTQTIKNEGELKFIKTKNGIIHTFCESDVKKFARKQRRRVQDFLYHKHVAKDRQFDWEDKDITGSNPGGMIKFILYCITIFPLFFQALKGYSKKADVAWFFHVLACEITLWEYGIGRIKGMFKKAEADRSSWKQ